MRKYTSSIAAIFICIAVPITAQTVKVNFTGNWVLNASKSVKTNNPVTKIVVTQDSKTLTEVTTTDLNGKLTATTHKYSLYGETSSSDENYKYFTMVSWTSDGMAMRISTFDTYIGKKVQVGTSSSDVLLTQTWALQDPKTLIITRTSGDTPGQNSVYDKK